ncbi:MAG: hypothetical protein RJA81_1287, partial [Planctomycetota bacterium]
IQALASLKDQGSIAPLTDLARDQEVGPEAMAALGQIGSETSVKNLIQVLGSDVSVNSKIAAMKALTVVDAKASVTSSLNQLANLASSENQQIRAALVGLLSEHPQAEITRKVLRNALDDSSVDVVKSAMAAISRIQDHDSVPALLKKAGDNQTKFEAMAALADMPDARATRIYLAGLTEKNPQLRRASATALTKISEEAVPTLQLLATRNELPSTALAELRKIYNRPVPLKSWQLIGPFGKGDNAAVDAQSEIDFAKPMTGRKGVEVKWAQNQSEHPQGMFDLAKLFGSENDTFVLGVADIQSDSNRKAQLAVGSDDTLTVWLNGKQIYDFPNSRGWSAEADSIDVELNAGSNRIIIKCGNNSGPWQFSIGVTQPAEYAFLKGPAPGAFDSEDFRKKTLEQKGDLLRGQKLFADVNGLACVKCHAVNGQGGAVGPDLTGIATKYTTDEIATSILYPSAKIASGYESVIVATRDGRVITGVIKADTTSGLELEDADAKRIRIELDDIEERRTAEVSIMPNGLAEGLKPSDFADLLMYLSTLKEQPKSALEKSEAGGSQ